MQGEALESARGSFFAHPSTKDATGKTTWFGICPAPGGLKMSLVRRDCIMRSHPAALRGIFKRGEDCGQLLREMQVVLDSRVQQIQAERSTARVNRKHELTITLYSLNAVFSMSTPSGTSMEGGALDALESRPE